MVMMLKVPRDAKGTTTCTAKAGAELQGEDIVLCHPHSPAQRDRSLIGVQQEPEDGQIFKDGNARVPSAGVKQQPMPWSPSERSCHLG